MSQVIKYEEQKKEIETLKAMAAIAVNSGKYDGNYNEATVLNIFLTAKSLGIDPMVALNGGFNIIKGKINMGAHFMTALARRKGHSIKVVEMTETKCVIIAQRKDNGDSLKYEYTWQEAQRAGLTGKDNWRNNPKQMLYCGCVRNIFRMLFSDLGIAYDADEMNIAPIEEESAIEVEIPLPKTILEAQIDQKEPQPDHNALEKLKERLELDGVSIEKLEQYLDYRAKEKKCAVEDIVKAALEDLIYPKFKTFYLKYVSKIESELEQAG